MAQQFPKERTNERRSRHAFLGSLIDAHDCDRARCLPTPAERGAQAKPRPWILIWTDTLLLLLLLLLSFLQSASLNGHGALRTRSAGGCTHSLHSRRHKTIVGVAF